MTQGAAPGVTLPIMPTKHQRHTITEVGPVATALERAREVRADVKAADLVVLGAEVLVERERAAAREDEQRGALRRGLRKRVIEGSGLDEAALSAAREHAWSRDA